MSESTKSPVWKAITDFLFEEQPKGVGWTHIFGSSLLLLLTIQVATGALLALYYNPSPDAALASIKYIEQQVAFGSFLRGIHHWAASLFVIILGLHLLRTFLYGAYKKPRRWTWVAGVLLLVLILGMAFTGYLLPWDMKGYFATKVGIEVGALVPFIGEAVKKVLQGGAEMGIKTLNRFYVWHILWIPLAIAAVVGAHLYFIRAKGITPPGKSVDETGEKDKPFFPSQAWKDFTGMAIVTLVLLGLALFVGAPIGEKADPTTTSFVPRPEWYFYPLYQLLRIFEGPLEVVGGAILPGILILGMLLLPWLDRNPERKLRYRPLMLSLGVIVPLAVGILTLWGWQTGQQLQKKYVQETSTPEWYHPEQPANDDLVDAGLYNAYLPMRCGSCHDHEAQGVNIPPSLYGAGDRYQRHWLDSYLLQPYDRRYEKKEKRPVERMPDYRLTKSEAQKLAAFLSNETGEDSLLHPDIDWTERDTAAVAKGKQLYAEYKCDGCHTINGTGGEVGPALDGVGQRLKPDWMYTFIGDARRLIPETPMKEYDLWPEERKAMTYYLLSLRGEEQK